MVLGGGHGQDSLPVGEGQEGGLFTFEELLDDDRVSRITEGFLFHAEPYSFLGLLEGLADDGSFAGRKAVGFDHDGRADLLQVCPRCVCVIENLVSAAGDIVLGQEVLGEHLAALDLGSGLAGAEDSQARVLKGVHYPEGQGQLGTDTRQADALTDGKIHQGPYVGHIDGHHIRLPGYPRIARSAVHLGDPRGLVQFPHQGVLTTSTADN